MASYDRSSNQSQGGMDNMGSSVENRGFFNKMLRNLSNWGMDKDQLVIKNSITTGVHEEADEGANGANMYDIFSKKIISKILDRKSIAFLDRAYEDKRKILRQYSIKDEIKDFVTEIADECIIYDDNNYFCGVRDLPDEFDNTIKQRYQETFSKLYRNFGFNDGLTAWNYMKNFLIDGYIAYELILDNKQKNIIDMQPIDPMTVVVAADPESGNIIWIQHPDNPQNRRVLLDAQIVYISYSNNNEFGEVSYVENLIRPYNQLKMIEQTRLLFNINQAAIYKKFVIPTNGLTRQQAEQQIYQLMSEYHEDVQWDDRMGTVSINGSTDIPHSKDFWFPNSEAGTPSIDIESPGGIDLNEDAMLQWFFKILKRASKIPFSRFDDDNGGGSLHGDIAEMTRDEIKFGTFIDRIRTLFKELIMKPLKIQMILDFPELKDDNLFHSSLYLEFNSNELFEEWKYLNNLSKKADIASSLSSNLQDNEGNPYLTVEWLIKNVMKMSDADIAENEKYKSQGSAAGGGEGGGDGGGSGGGGGDDFGGGDEGGDFGGGDESGDFGGGDEGGGDEGGGDSGGDAGGGDDPFEF